MVCCCAVFILTDIVECNNNDNISRVHDLVIHDVFMHYLFIHDPFTHYIFIRYSY